MIEVIVVRYRKGHDDLGFGLLVLPDTSIIMNLDTYKTVTRYLYKTQKFVNYTALDHGLMYHFMVTKQALATIALMA